MLVTLELDDDLVAVAQQLARQQGSTLSRVISSLAKRSLPDGNGQASSKMRNGVQPFAREPGAPTLDLEFINKLRDEE